MVNTLQLIIQLQMMNVIMPSNVIYFLNFIVDIVNFKVIPADSIITTVLHIKSSATSEVSLAYQSAGFTSTNILKNISLGILGVLLLSVLLLSLYGLLLIKKKF